MDSFGGWTSSKSATKTGNSFGFTALVRHELTLNPRRPNPDKPNARRDSHRTAIVTVRPAKPWRAFVLKASTLRRD